jgi:hypothetical protein
MTSNEIIKECRALAKTQNISFSRSKTIDRINSKACYVIVSGIECKILHRGCLATIWDTLLSENLANQ